MNMSSSSDALTPFSFANGYKPEQKNHWFFTRYLVPILIFVIALGPRATYLVARSTLWHQRAKEFIEAIDQRVWERTLLTSHPGVTTMWLAGIGRQFGIWFTPDFAEQPLYKQMAFELFPLVVVISLAIVLSYFLLARIFGYTVATVGAFLLATDPFHISVSKTLHVDAIMSVFVLVSALSILVYINPIYQGNRYPIVFSGFFAGLALLSKTPALFLVPYFFLCLGAWKLTQLITLNTRNEISLLAYRDWFKAIGDVSRDFLLWVGVLAATFFIFWPAMWTVPQSALSFSFSETIRYSETPHPNPILFMGKITQDDPGIVYYPVILALKSTEITLPFFLLSFIVVFSRRLDSYQRMALLLIIAGAVFFTLQMSLAAKKQDRYDLPAFQFFIFASAISSAYVLTFLAQGRRWLAHLLLTLVVVVQFALSLSHHPYYGTHYNRLIASPKTILENQIVSGQEQGEGLDIAAAYLNSLPYSQLQIVGTQNAESFSRYYIGKTVSMTDDKVDYLVFSRNWVTRGMMSEKWESLWEQYKDRQPKFVVYFSGVPYVWVYKVSPIFTEATIPHLVKAQIGQDIRLLGYDFQPDQVSPGETVQLTLYWEAVTQPQKSYTVFVHLLDPTGKLQGQQDNPPQQGTYPTNFWNAGEWVQDTYTLVVSPDAPPGNYQIAVGMYELETLERLPVTATTGESLPDSRLLLPGLTVIQSIR